MSSITLAELRAMVRELGDFEAATAFVDNDELDDRINDHLGLLYDKLCLVRGDQYFAESKDFATVAGQALYRFVEDMSIADFYRLVRVTANNGDRHVDVPTWEFADYAALKSAELHSVNALDSLRYRLMPEGIHVLPAPTDASVTFTMHYIPRRPTLRATSDEVPHGMHPHIRWAALGAAIDLVNKEEGDPSALVMVKNEVDALITQLAPSRDEGRPFRIANVSRDDMVSGTIPGVNDWYY